LKVTAVSPSAPGTTEREAWLDGVPSFASARRPPPPVDALSRHVAADSVRVACALRRLDRGQFETVMVLHRPQPAEPELVRRLGRRALRTLPRLLLEASR